jgi:ankyrin repeat protein
MRELLITDGWYCFFEQTHRPWMASVDRNEVVSSMLECARYCDEGDADDLTELLSNDGTLVDAQDVEGRTALHMAAANGHTLVAKIIFKFDPKANVANENGNTALHYAATGNHMAVAMLLLRHGWEVTAVNHRGLTPMQAIADKDFKDMEVLLLRHDKKLDEYKAEGASAAVDEEAEAMQGVAAGMAAADNDDDDELNDDDDDEPEAARQAAAVRRPQEDPDMDGVE